MTENEQHVDRLMGLPATAESFFLLRTYEAVLRLKGFVDSFQEDAPAAEGRFLTAYENEIRDILHSDDSYAVLLSVWSAHVESLKEHIPNAPLLRLEADAGRPAVDAFLLAGLPEEDSRFGVLFGRLQTSQVGRPAVELLANVIRHSFATSHTDRAIRRLVSTGFLAVSNPAAPRSEWIVNVPASIWDAAKGERPMLKGFRWEDLRDAPTLEDVIATAPFKQRVKEVANSLKEGRIDTAVVRGSVGSDRDTIARALAAEAGNGTITLTAEALAAMETTVGPVCKLSSLIPIVSFDLGPGETKSFDDIPGYSGPIIVTNGPSGGLEGAAFKRAVELNVAWPGVGERVRCWREQLSIDDVAAGGFDRRFTLPIGHIRFVSSRARTLAELDGSPSVNVSHVREACRALNRQLLDELADAVAEGGNWHQLVVPDATMIKLRELELRCMHRDRLDNHLGTAFRARSQRGVRALLSGPSGTGKTLAVQILASELDVDLYRLNLAAIVDKYVGETEKRLDRLLSVAEELDVVLLLDEGDSILGKRTSVRTANDRFANTATNFLLQRLEQYRGLVLVTSNAPDAIDPGFARRMDIVVDFHPPGPEERYHIWQLHLPHTHAVDPGYMEQVALRCPLTGGQIRNAALHAALLSVQEQGPITARHLELSVRSEFLKQGATFPSLEAGGDAVRSGMRSFVDTGTAIA